MTSSPKDLPQLDTESEHMHLETALQDAKTNGMVKIHWLSGKTWQDLREVMLNGPWHIFHFIGHGDFDSETGEGLIALEDDEGNAQRVKATELATLLADHSPLRLVVLNSCEEPKEGISITFSLWCVRIGGQQ